MNRFFTWLNSVWGVNVWIFALLLVAFGLPGCTGGPHDYAFVGTTSDGAGPGPGGPGGPPLPPPPPPEVRQADIAADAVAGDRVMSLAAGWNGMTFPLGSLTSTSGFPEPVLYWWDTGSQAYQTINVQQFPSFADTKRGYWAYSPSTVQVAANGPEIAPGTPESISLAAGWNFLGFRAPDPTRFDSMLVNGAPLLSSLGLRSTDGKPVYGFAFRYDPSLNNYRVVDLRVAGTKSLVGTAYWVYCWQQCLLTYTTPTPNYTLVAEIGGLSVPAHPTRGSIIVPNFGAANNIQVFSEALTLLQTLTVTGLGGDGDPWQGPVAAATDGSGKVFVADRDSGRIIRYDQGFINPTVVALPINRLQDIAASGGNVAYLSIDSFGVARISRMTSAGTQLGTWSFAWTNPVACALDSNNQVYVTDGQQRVTRNAFDGTGATNLVTGLTSPYGLDVYNSRLAICNAGTDTVRVYNLGGTLLAEFGSSGTGAGQFQFPTGVTILSDGSIAVTDSTRGTISVWKP